MYKLETDSRNRSDLTEASRTSNCAHPRKINVVYTDIKTTRKVKLTSEIMQDPTQRLVLIAEK